MASLQHPEARALFHELHELKQAQTASKPAAILISKILDLLVDCFKKCLPDRSMDPSQLTVFHQMVRAIPEDKAFPLYHLVSSTIDDVIKFPKNQALAVGEYWIARNQLAKAKVLLNQLYPQDENDCRVQDAIFRTTWYEKHGIPEKVGYELRGRYCALPFGRVEIYEGGSTFVCCPAWLPKSIGNIFEAGKIDDVWNSEDAREIRRTIVDGSYRYCRKISCAVISGVYGDNLVEKIPVTSGSSEKEQDGHLSAPPKDIKLAYDPSCNLSCPSCRREKKVSTGVEAKRIFQVTRDVIFPLLKTARSLSLNGSGEVFVSPAFRWLLSQVALAGNPAMIVDLQTNGLLFTEQEWTNIKGLGSLHLVVDVSIDASEEKTYALLRRGGDFKRLLHNLEFLRTLRDKELIKELLLRCIVQEENVDELESFVLLGKQYHADIIHFQMFHDFQSCSPRELARKMIQNPGHPRHRQFLENLSKALLHNNEIQIRHEFEYLNLKDVELIKAGRKREEPAILVDTVPVTAESSSVDPAEVEALSHASVISHKSHKMINAEFTSCAWIEHGLVLFDGLLACCCIGEHEGGGRPTLITNYHGQLINYDDLFKAKWVRRNLQRQGKTNKECVGCCFLETRKDWDERDIIKSMTLAYWTHCNCQCIYCYTEENKEGYNKNKPYSSLPAIKDLIDKGYLARNAYVSFGGGECTILSEFEELANLLITHGAYLEIFSNGIKFSPTIKKGISKNKMCVTISVDAGTSETFKKIKQVDAFSRVWNNIGSYAEIQPLNGLSIKLKYILVPGINDTVEEIKTWMEMSKNHGVREVLLDIDHNYFKVHRNDIPEKLLLLERYVVSRARELGMHYERTRNFLQIPKTK